MMTKSRLNRKYTVFYCALLLVMILLQSCTTQVNFLQAKIPFLRPKLSDPIKADPVQDKQAKTLALAEGMAAIYVLKPGKNDLTNIMVFLNGEYIASLYDGLFGYVHLQPGKYRIKTVADEFKGDYTWTYTYTRPIAIRVAELEVEVRANEMMFIEQLYSPSGEERNYKEFRLMRLPYSDGEKKMKSMHLSPSNKYSRYKGEVWPENVIEPCQDSVMFSTFLSDPRKYRCVYTPTWGFD